MSQFDQYTNPHYVEAMRVFLALNKRGFLKSAGFVSETAESRVGRLPGYDAAAIQRLEDQVNAKASVAESSSITLGKRYAIARDYQGYTDTQVAAHMNVSRELARQWALDTYVPKDIPKLAKFLKVSPKWLKVGGAHNLLPSSHIGVRVGTELKAYKESLYGQTVALFDRIPEHIRAGDEGYLQTYIEVAINSDKQLGTLARRAGGRWQLVGGKLQFAPWAPIAAPKKIKSVWTPEVDQMIEEELATKPTVTEAWNSLAKRAQKMGLSDKQFPKKISLHKRAEADRQRQERFGVNVNDIIRKSVEANINKFFQ